MLDQYLYMFAKPTGLFAIVLFKFEIGNAKVANDYHAGASGAAIDKRQHLVLVRVTTAHLRVIWLSGAVVADDSLDNLDNLDNAAADVERRKVARAHCFADDQSSYCSPP